MLRKINIFCIIGIVVTLLAHGIMGSLLITGAGTDALKNVARASVGFICAHIIITSILAAQTLHAGRMTGRSYFRNNAMFWARRISGLVILIPLYMHLVIFTSEVGDAYRLQAFTTGRLVSQILLIAAIALHVLINIRPLLISLGIRDLKAFSIDTMLVISIMLLLFGIAFCVYYMRWMSF